MISYLVTNKLFLEFFYIFSDRTVENKVQVLVETLEGKDVKDEEIVKSMQDVFSEGHVLDFHEDADMDGPVTYLMVDRGIMEIME